MTKYSVRLGTFSRQTSFQSCSSVFLSIHISIKWILQNDFYATFQTLYHINPSRMRIEYMKWRLLLVAFWKPTCDAQKHAYSFVVHAIAIATKQRSNNYNHDDNDIDNMVCGAIMWHSGCLRVVCFTTTNEYDVYGDGTFASSTFWNMNGLQSTVRCTYILTLNSLLLLSRVTCTLHNAHRLSMAYCLLMRNQ